jgi:hypothetical protein
MPGLRAPASITIRPAYADDQAALARLAALDSAAGVPATQHLVRLLRAHAAAVTPTRARGSRRPSKRLRTGFAAG